MSKDRQTRSSHSSGGEGAGGNEQIVARIEAKNALRQFDAMVDLIHQSSRDGFRLGRTHLCELNLLAVDGLVRCPGEFRDCEVQIDGSRHRPPSPADVPVLVDEMCAYVNQNWSTSTPIHLASYLMWRVNWIHPFENGNGRTSRAISYAVMCIKIGALLPGTPTIPEQIAKDKQPYYKALDAADDAWNSGVIDVSKMESLLTDGLCVQLANVVESASGRPLV